MQFGNIIIFILIAALVLWLRSRRARKHNTPPMRKKPGLAPVYVCSFRMTKDTPYACLQQLGRRFGRAYEEKNIPEPCGTDCVCEHHSSLFSQAGYFEEKQGKAPYETELYQTDLGSLDFISNKYYRYRLLERAAPSPAERSEFRALYTALTPEPAFVQKVNSHLA